MKILEGYRILDASTHGVGPTAASILSDWGAEVIKIEDPESPDIMRQVSSWGLNPPEGGNSLIFHVFNRGKRSVAINLKSEGGHEALMKLVETSDVFLTSFLSGVRQRLSIDVEDVRARNPRIIYARNTGRGTRGPFAELGGFDATSMWSRGGLAHGTTPLGAEIPTSVPAPGFGDTQTGFALASGIVAALLHRERTGEAITVDTSLLHTGIWAMQGCLSGADLLGTEDFRRPERGATAPLINSYRTKDGRFIHLCMDQHHYWPSFCEAVGHPEWLEDPLIGAFEAREANAAYCIGLLEQMFLERDYKEWLEVLARQRGPFDPVQKIGELPHDPQVIANGYLSKITDEVGRQYSLVQPPVQFNSEPYETHRGPGHGDQTDEVLTELGYTMDELIDLKISGAIL